MTSYIILCRLRSVHDALKQQTSLLEHVARTLNVTSHSGFVPHDAASIPFADEASISVYDNLAVGNVGMTSRVDRERYKSIRVSGQERPHSVII